MAGQITHSQELIESMLLAEPYFDDITVLRFDKGDIQNQVDVVIGRVGICALILTPKMTVRFKDTPGPFFEINTSVEVIENVIINRSGSGTNKSAPEVAEYVAATVHHSPAPGDNVFGAQSVELTGIGQNERNQVVITYAVDFISEGGLALDVNQTATPILTGTSTITITCATVGASIFYTLDGKNPGPQTGTLYTAPVAISSGTTIKARAWIWGYTVSQQASYTRP